MIFAATFPWRPYPQSILWSMRQEAMAWCSMQYKLNPWSESALHQASSKTAAVSQGDQGLTIKISKFKSIPQFTDTYANSFISNHGSIMDVYFCNSS